MQWDSKTRPEISWNVLVWMCIYRLVNQSNVRVGWETVLKLVLSWILKILSACQFERLFFACCAFVTSRKRSYGKIMFLHLSVILFMGDVWLWVQGGCVPVSVGGVHPPDIHTHTNGTHPPNYQLRSTSRRYASYWNAFLLLKWILSDIYFSLV